MDISQLWTPLEPITENRALIRQDLERGLAPNLPYFIVGLEDVKSSLGELISNLDDHFSYGMIWGQYGNGKSNLMKYLRYYFEQHSESHAKVSIWRADVDRYDIVTFLLYILQNEFESDLLSSLKAVVEDGKISDMCDSNSGSFGAIKGFVDQIAEKIDAEDDLKTLVALGTGKYYDANKFKPYGLQKLTDYNRREVLVFFLNALAYTQHYIIFCIDELEKIQEKSKARFQSFLTTFRELIDLSSSIHGHMILGSITDAVSKTGDHSFDSYNPAFERRIKDYKYELKSIRDLNDIKEMARELVRVLDIAEPDSYDDVANAVYKKISKLRHTSDVVRAVFVQLNQQTGAKTWEDLLTEAKLTEAFEEKRQELKDSGVLSRVDQKLFAPLKDYVNILSNRDDDYDVRSQMLQCVYSKATNRCYVFLITDGYDANINRLRNVMHEFPGAELYVFKPEGLDISMGSLVDKEKIDSVKNLIPYDPIDLMALLELYMEDYNNPKLAEILNLYTHQL